MKLKTTILSLLLTFLYGVSNAQTNALNFDGINDKVKLNFNPAMDFGNNSSFSIEMWFKTTVNTAELVSDVINTIPAKGQVVGIINGTPYFYFGNAAPSNMIYVATATAFNNGNWHHLACTYNGSGSASGVKIYVDGILQTVNIGGNSLTLPANSGAAYNVGFRNDLQYYYPGSMDELRFWGKELCITEINARKNCELVGNEPQLLAYYNFNQGIAGGTNTGIITLPDNTGGATTGTLSSFALSGAASNWIPSTTSISGTCSYTYVTITGNTTICNGGSTTLTANGATTYSWNFGPTSPLVIVNPSVTTTYSVYSTSSPSCSGISTVTVNVNSGSSPTIAVMSSTSTICSGNSVNLSSAGANTYSWSNSAIGSFIIVSPTVSTNYTVTGTSTLTGCAGTNTLAITVNSLPTLVITSSSPSICLGQQVTIGVSGATNYSWNTGATSPIVIISPTITSSYNVVGTNSITGCTNTSAISITVDNCTVGFNSNKLNFEEITLYPNPSSGNINIKAIIDVDLIIINELGQIVKNISLNGMNNRTESVNNLAEGIYFITSTSKNTLLKQKLIIVK